MVTCHNCTSPHNFLKTFRLHSKIMTAAVPRSAHRVVQSAANRMSFTDTGGKSAHFSIMVDTYDIDTVPSLSTRHLELKYVPITATPADIRRLCARSNVQGVSDGAPYVVTQNAFLMLLVHSIYQLQVVLSHRKCPANSHSSGLSTRQSTRIQKYENFWNDSSPSPKGKS